MNNTITSPNSPGATKFQPKIISPTKEQQVIQAATDRTLLIEANAGAAKTTTLALRIAESWSRGMPPELLLILTYTDTACRAIKDALRKIGVPHSIVTRLRIQTFEAFSSEVLNEILGVKIRVIESAEILKPYVWQAVKRVEENESERWRSDLLMPTLGDNGMVEEFLRINILLKGTMRDVLYREDNPVTPDYAGSIGVEYTQLKTFLAYERIRRQEFAEMPLFRGAVDATYDLARMLYEEESINGLVSWPSSIKVLMVDEMHDMNQATFRVLQELLNSTACFFCGVGDRDQVIHETTGAESRFMESEIEMHTSRKIRRYPLTHSYRFGKTLAIKAGRVSDKPYSSMAAHETEVSLQAYENDEDCVRQVTERAAVWQTEPRAKMSEFAILLRHAYQSVPIENMLLSRNIPYVVSGLESYLMRPEVLFVRGLLAVAVNGLESVAEISTRQKVMEALLFFSGSRIEVEARKNESQEELLRSAIRTVTEVPHFLVDFFNNHVLRNAEPLMRMRLQAAVAEAQKSAEPYLLKRVLDALEIESIIREVLVVKLRREEALNNLIGVQRASASFHSAQAYFESLNNAEKKQRELRQRSDCLVIASILNVKGLEFDHVVLPFLERGVFPDPTAQNREEQNLFYVGMTRARKVLTMLGKVGSPSPLLAKAGYQSSNRDEGGDMVSSPTPALQPLA